jgi:hypothetical protein
MISWQGKDSLGMDEILKPLGKKMKSRAFENDYQHLDKKYQELKEAGRHEDAENLKEKIKVYAEKVISLTSNSSFLDSNLSSKEFAFTNLFIVQ